MLRDKMRAVMSELCGITAERDELIEAIAVALLTRKNLFILGDVGQAKSYVINEFRKRITGARQFERLLSKQADEEQLFGRVDLSSLIPGNADERVLEQDETYRRLDDELRQAYETCRKQDSPEAFEAMDDCRKRLESCRQALYAMHGNRPRINTIGKIPDSHIVFLDEIYKANDGILNSLLTALNERRYTNEGETVDIPAISFFSASNEIPNWGNAEESILKALHDRMEIKVVTHYVESRANRLRVLKDKQTGNTGLLQNTITLDDLYAMQKEVAAVAVPDAINELMDDILCELREKSVHISDRKYFGYHPLAQAYAWLQGRAVVEASDLLILRHYLWTAPEEITAIRQLLERKCVNPLREALADILKMGLECYDDFDAAAGSDAIKRIGKLRDEYLNLYESLTDLLGKAQTGEETDRINGTVAQLEDYSKKAHAAVNFTYTPLNELRSFKKLA